MADEKKPPGPYYPPTTRLPKVEVEENKLTAILSEVRAARAENADRFVEVFTKLDRHEDRITAIEQRQNANSQRVRGVSANDLGQDAAIAEIRSEVALLRKEQADTAADVTEIKKETAEQTKMLREALTKATGFFKHPKVVFVGKVIFGICVAYAAGKGLIAK